MMPMPLVTTHRIVDRNLSRPLELLMTVSRAKERTLRVLHIAFLVISIACCKLKVGLHSSA